jgi:hypothetical protein
MAPVLLYSKITKIYSALVMVKVTIQSGDYGASCLSLNPALLPTAHVIVGNVLKSFVPQLSQIKLVTMIVIVSSTIVVKIECANTFKHMS